MTPVPLPPAFLRLPIAHRALHDRTQGRIENAPASIRAAVQAGYGIEIDCTTPSSPPGTVVAARAVDVFGPGISAEMAYYETPAGARVFSAGALDFCSSVMTWPVWKLLDNLWEHMVADLPAPPPPPV